LGKENKKMTISDAKKVLQEEETRKAEAFLAEYRALCEKHGLQIQASPVQFIVVPIRPLENR